MNILEQFAIGVCVACLIVLFIAATVIAVKLAYDIITDNE